MPDTKLYFLSDQYYIDFKDDMLMKNKEAINGVLHSRPCFYAFKDNENRSIFWIVPITSRCEKFKVLERASIQKYGRCNTIRFGEVLGRENAFLIQNMCPAISKYLIPYINKNNVSIRIDEQLAKDIEKNARHVLGIAKHWTQIIFPDVFKIYHELEQQLKESK